VVGVVPGVLVGGPEGLVVAVVDVGVVVPVEVGSVEDTAVVPGLALVGDLGAVVVDRDPAREVVVGVVGAPEVPGPWLLLAPAGPELEPSADVEGTTAEGPCPRASCSRLGVVVGLVPGARIRKDTAMAPIAAAVPPITRLGRRGPVAQARSRSVRRRRRSSSGSSARRAAIVFSGAPSCPRTGTTSSAGSSQRVVP